MTLLYGEAPWAEWAGDRWDMVLWEVLTEWAILVAPEEDNDQIRYRNKKAAGASNEVPAVMRSIGSASLVQTVHDPLLLKLYIDLSAKSWDSFSAYFLCPSGEKCTPSNRMSIFHSAVSANASPFFSAIDLYKSPSKKDSLIMF